jgi:pentatricopeptide repeat protein
MQAYERAGKWQACVGALARGAALGVVPSASMYTTAISAAGKAGQLAVADALFAQARAAGVSDHTTYETMVAVLGMAGESGRAEVVLRAMEAAGFRPGDYAYCGLIAGYSLSNDPLSAQRVRTRIVRKHGPGSVSVHIYNALLAAADRAGAYDKALELLRCMRREGVEGNTLTQQLAAEVGRKGAVEVEGQQLTAAALSAAMAAAGTLLMRSGVW